MTTHTERLDQIRREHDAKMATLRKDGAKRLDDVGRFDRELRVEHDLRNRLKREEDRIAKHNEDAVEIARRRTSWKRFEDFGWKLSERELRDQHADVEETVAADRNHPQVVRLREWVHALAAQERIDLREDAAPQLRNGSAVQSLKRATIAPVQSFETAAVAAHELGHVLGTMNPNAPKKPGEFGLGVVCVDDELNAWRWALAHVPVWNEPMRTRMTECLESYRPNATEDESKQIDQLISGLTFRATQLRILKGR